MQSRAKLAAAAFAAGRLTYLSRPCRKGHSGERYASNHKCVECTKEHTFNAYHGIVVAKAPDFSALYAGRRAVARTNRKSTFLGRECMNCHDCERYVSNGRCVHCFNEQRSNSWALIVNTLRILRAEGYRL